MQSASGFRCWKIPAFIALTGMYLSGCQQFPAQELAAFDEEPPSELQAVQNEFAVSTLTDDGPGSLRQAILLANASPGADKIIFRSDSDLFKSPQTVQLASPLPVITDHLMITGFIENMLWQASGITVSGDHQHRILEVAENTQVRIRYLTFHGGNADQGGAILNHGHLQLESSLLFENKARKQGGAIFNRGQLSLVNTTLVKNHAEEKGAGLFNDAGSSVVVHSTFSWNTAAYGGAVANEGRLRINNSILYGNGNLDCLSDKPFDQPERRNIISQQQGCGKSYSDSDPKLGRLNYYNGPTMSVPPGTLSPAINRGNNKLAVNGNGEPLVWDQRGNGDPRFVAGLADIGAFEVQSRTLLEVDTLENSDKRWCTRLANDCSLIGAMMIAGTSPRFSTITFKQELFSSPVTLEIDEPLPEMSYPITLDATGGAAVIIKGQGVDKLQALSPDKLILHNVTFEK